MTESGMATIVVEGAEQRYRRADEALWGEHGLDPSERFLELEAPRARLRVLEIGSGSPVIFVHGTAGPGAWPSLIQQLPGIRSIVVERPGWGLSSPIDFSRSTYDRLTTDLMTGLMNALDLERADVVGASIGNVWALRLAAAQPSRVGRVVLLGGAPIVDAAEPPRIIRMIASPLGALMVRLPPRRGMELKQIRQNGHGASLDAGRFPESFVTWRLAMAQETKSMHHERSMVQAILGGGKWRNGLTFDEASLGAIRQPTLHLWGTADPVGDAATWDRLAATLPAGELRRVEGAGHTPWLDEPQLVGGIIRDFLRGSGR